jgi:hypothetical protein
LSYITTFGFVVKSITKELYPKLTLPKSIKNTLGGNGVVY